MDAASEIARESAAVEMHIPSGVAIAALLAGVIGLLTLGVVNILADVSRPFSNALTLNPGIGPYSGKELFMFAAWFGSWIVLHLLLRKRELNMRKWFGAIMALLLVSVLLVWPPIFEAIADAIKGGA